MENEPKGLAQYDSFAALDIRVGRVTNVRPAEKTRSPAYIIEIDFGPVIGRKVSVGRFTRHGIDELTGRLVVGVVNFAPRKVGPHVSECLVLGAPYPGAEVGEATILTPVAEAELGSSIF